MYKDLEKELNKITRYLKKFDTETLLYAGNFIATELNKRELKNKIYRRNGLFKIKELNNYKVNEL